VKVALAVAAARRRFIRAVLGAEALHRRPRRNLRAVDREVFVRQKPAHLLVVQQPSQEVVRDLRLQQPFPVLREHRRHPHRLIDPEPDEPAVQQVVVELLHQLPLRADRVEHLQQKRAQQPLGRNRRPSAVGESLVNSPSSATSTSLTIRRIRRSGCSVGTRSSRSTYENSSPLRSSVPRILASCILGGLAEFERTLIRARTGEGRERAKARGVRFGRPKKLSAHQRREAIDRINAGEAVAEVARTFGVDRATMYRLRP
jgi:hypothetical protein